MCRRLRFFGGSLGAVVLNENNKLDQNNAKFNSVIFSPKRVALSRSKYKRKLSK